MDIKRIATFFMRSLILSVLLLSIVIYFWISYIYYRVENISYDILAKCNPISPVQDSVMCFNEELTARQIEMLPNIDVLWVIILGNLVVIMILVVFLYYRMTKRK